MPAPATAVAHLAAMDPFDRVEYITRFSSLLEGGEKISSATITLYPEAVALGFTILGTAEFGPSILNDDSIRTWVEVAAAMRDQPAYAVGARMPVEFTITTNATPFRRFKRTMIIVVTHQ